MSPYFTPRFGSRIGSAHTAADEVVEVISCVLSRIVYEAIKEIQPRNSYPVNLVLEEAHRYIGDDPQRSFLKANRIFELIAKEGRKFGMLLLISSQRPSELSKTVLSQCSNFIVHRIQNPEDLSHIRQITPHISETILKRMPSIPIQHALIFGHAVNLPTTFKVNQANPKPRSDNNQISRNWFKAKNHVAFHQGPQNGQQERLEGRFLSNRGSDDALSGLAKSNIFSLFLHFSLDKQRACAVLLNHDKRYKSRKDNDLRGM